MDKDMALGHDLRAGGAGTPLDVFPGVTGNYWQSQDTPPMRRWKYYQLAFQGQTSPDGEHKGGMAL